jgi:hypothetical protein
MEADRKAFAALMHHLAEKDSPDHTVLMMQVENESGGIGAARDYSTESNREIGGQVPDSSVGCKNGIDLLDCSLFKERRSRFCIHLKIAQPDSHQTKKLSRAKLYSFSQ